MKKYLHCARLLLLTLLLTACGQAVEVQPLPAGSTILAFGDSITHGTGAARIHSYPLLLGEKTGMNIVNGGIPGDTAARAGGRIQSLLGQHQPALVILELGGNDFLAKTPATKVKEDLRGIIRAIRERDIPVVVVAVPSFSVLRASAGRLKDNDLYAELGEEENILIIEQVLADILSTDSLRADPIHPNAQGYQVLAEGIYQALQEAGFIGG